MKRLLESDASEQGFKAQEYNKGEEGEFLGLIHKIVEEAIAQPNKVITTCINHSQNQG